MTEDVRERAKILAHNKSASRIAELIINLIIDVAKDSTKNPEHAAMLMLDVVKRLVISTSPAFITVCDNVEACKNSTEAEMDEGCFAWTLTLHHIINGAESWYQAMQWAQADYEDRKGKPSKLLQKSINYAATGRREFTL